MQVDPTKLNVLAAWKHNYTLETVLVELRRLVGLRLLSPLSGPGEPRLTKGFSSCREMATPNNRKLAQPAEGTNF